MFPKLPKQQREVRLTYNKTSDWLFKHCKPAQTSTSENRDKSLPHIHLHIRASTVYRTNK